MHIQRRLISQLNFRGISSKENIKFSNTKSIPNPTQKGPGSQILDGNILKYQTRHNYGHFGVCVMSDWGRCMGRLSSSRTIQDNFYLFVERFPNASRVLVRCSQQGKRLLQFPHLPVDQWGQCLVPHPPQSTLWSL